MTSVMEDPIVCVDCSWGADDLSTCELCGAVGCECVVSTQRYDCGEAGDGMDMCVDCAPSHRGCPDCDPVMPWER